jgi:hypothetical protein
MDAAPPGAALLREIALPLAMLLGAFGWGAWIFLREATRITDELIASEARARMWPAMTR